MEFDGDVVEVLPQGYFRVKLNNVDHIVLVYLAGKMRKNKIKVVLGDKVKIEMDSTDLNRGRLVYRYKE